MYRKWEKDTCAKLAKGCSTAREFKKKHGGAYQACVRNGWLKEVGSHFTYAAMPPGYWTDKRLANDAAKYEYRIDFKNFSNVAYQTARRRKILDLVCAHMVPKGNRKLRQIYEIWNATRDSVYVGLTCSISQRQGSHKRRGKLKKYFGEDFELIPVTGLLPIEQAKHEEIQRIIKHREAGLLVVNKQNGGNLGCGEEIYTKSDCEKIIRSFECRSKLKKQHPSVYSKAWKEGWLNNMCNHMDYYSTKAPYGYWKNKENCRRAALMCKTRREFEQRFGTAYANSHKCGWIDEICSHMPHLHRDARERRADYATP